MHAIVSAKVTPPSALVPAIGSAFDDVVARAMSRDPEKRFDSVRAFGAALLPFASAATRARWTKDLGAAVSAPAPRRRPLFWMGIALAALVGVTYAVVAGARRTPDSPMPPSPAVTATPTATAPTATATATATPTATSTSTSTATPTATSTATLTPTMRSAAKPPAARPSAEPAATERGTNGALIVE
jgi:hypothetical protein